MAAAPMMVRLSPGERADFEAKAARARLNRSDAARAALAAWQPDGAANAIRNSDTEETDTRRVVYDE